MATATIDELEIQIESDSNDASAAIDRLTQSLERLVNPVSTLTSSGSGLSKLSDGEVVCFGGWNTEPHRV